MTLRIKQENNGGTVLTLLLAFYVIWKMPVVAVHTNTYLAMFLLVALCGSFLLKSTGYFGRIPSVFMSAILLTLLTFLEQMYTGRNMMYKIWTAFLDFLPMILGSMLVFYGMEKQTKTVVWLIMVTYAVTAVTTYLGLQEYPTASRELATGSVDYAFYYRKNIGGFTYIYSLVVLHPVFVCTLRTIQKRWLSLAMTVLFALCVIESKYTMATLGFLLSCIAYFIPMGSSSKELQRRMFYGVLLMIFVYVFAPPVLDWLSELEMLEASAEKLKDIAGILRGEEAEYEGTIARQQAYEYSWNLFLEYPILGSRSSDYGTAGGHSYVLDIMALWGSVGLIVIVGILIGIYKYYRKLTRGTALFPFALLCFLLGVINIAFNALFWPYELGFAVPVFIYYTVCEQKKREKTETQGSDGGNTP